MNNYYVQVLSYTLDDPVEEMGPFFEVKAEKVDRGLNINLDHTQYYTIILQK